MSSERVPPVGLTARVRAGLRDERRAELAVWAVFALASLVMIVVLGYAGRGQTLKGDEWGYARRLATESLPHALFQTTPGKYLLVLPMLLYKGAFSTIGISDYVPYRVAGMVLTIACAALFLVLAARRVGYLLALPWAVLIVFLGSSSEVTATPLRIPTQIAMIAGLGMLVALDRRDLRGDIAACVLLAISITSHPLGIAFAGAAVVLVLARSSPERWRRAWVFVVPIVLFGIWFVVQRQAGPGTPSLGSQLSDVPRFEIQSLATMAASITGAFRSPVSGQFDYIHPLSYALAMVVIAVVAFRAVTTRLPASFWAILVAILILFAAPAFAPGGLRSPDASRYIFPGAIMLLLLLAEAVRGIEIGRRPVRNAALVATAAVFVFALYSNVAALDHNARIWAARGKQVRAELAALDIAGDRAAPLFQPEAPGAVPPIPSTHTLLTAHEYAQIKAAYGTPAFTPAELHTIPLADRGVADIVLARALGLKLHPATSFQPSPQAQRPRVLVTDAKHHDKGRSCVVLSPAHTPVPSQVAMPPGGAAIATGGRAPVSLALGRFSPGYPYPLQPLRRAGLLYIPPDSDSTPWRLLIRPTQQPVTVCGVHLAIQSQ